MASIMKEEIVSLGWQPQTGEDSNSRRILASLAENRSLGGGFAFNHASSLLTQSNAPVETEKGEEEEKSEKKEVPPAAAAENVSVVRKNLLIPAEEALDSARVAAELVMKDAMEALQRTKQRLMDILHRNSSSQAAPTADEVTKENPDDVNPDQEDDQQSNRTAKDIVHISSEPAMGFVFPMQQRSERITSRL